MEEIAPHLPKSHIWYFNNHLRTVDIFHQAIIFLAGLGQVQSPAGEDLRNQKTLLGDIEFQQNEDLHRPDESQEQRDGSFMSFRLTPLRFHVSRSEGFVNPNKLLDIGPT